MKLERADVFGALDVGATQRNFDRLSAGVPDTGGLSVGMRFGSTVPVTGFGGGNTMTLTVDHGLGRTPAMIQATAGWIPAASNSSAADQPVNCGIYGTVSDTQVQFLLSLPNGYTSSVGPSRVDWLVIG